MPTDTGHLVTWWALRSSLWEHPTGILGDSEICCAPSQQPVPASPLVSAVEKCINATSKGQDSLQLDHHAREKFNSL